MILPCFPCLALMVNLFKTPSLDGAAAISAALCPCGSGAHRAVCVKYWAVRCLEILPDLKKQLDFNACAEELVRNQSVVEK